MFAIALRYLTGRVVAAEAGHEGRVEWPPHPGRFYMALVAAHYEGRSQPPTSERECLEWLESQPAPDLVVPSAAQRTAVTHFVPVNDVVSPSGAQISSTIPIGRIRQARLFPSATLLEDDTVFLAWRDAELPGNLRAAFDGLCARVTRVGHSSSLVSCRITDEAPAPTLVPCDDGEASYRLRVPGHGRLAELDARFAAGLRPTAGRFTGYGAPKEPEVSVATSEFDEVMTVLRRVDGASPGIESCQALTTALRGALLRWSPRQPAPEVLSGHAEGGGRTEKTHPALVVLANVGHAHADGRVLGLGIAMPRAASSQDRQVVADALARWLEGDDGGGTLRTGTARMVLALEDREEPPITLQPEQWTAAGAEAHVWSTVTPMVLDRYPKREGDAHAIVVAACRRLGLPEPCDVVVQGTAWHRGVPPARRFPAFPGRPSARPLRHVLVAFDRPVRGPIVLGAGRYLGYGLCRPMQEHSA